MKNTTPNHQLLSGFGQRITAMRCAPADHEWSLDLFAGGGGWSKGYEAATGFAFNHACNHDHQAITCHEINHPATEHHEQSVWDADPRDLEPGRKLGYLHLSPDCTDFSKAKGGRPVSDRVRGLAWVALSWMYHRQPRVVTLENVEEFQQWGPLEATGKTCPKSGKPLKRPIKSRRGETFEAFIACMTTGLDPDHPAWEEIERVIPTVPREALERGLGCDVDYRELRACDYGAPTIRKRFFLIARCDGRPIRWPKPTHGPADHPDVVAGKLKPYRTAAEFIDWSLPMASIFLTPEEAKAWAKEHGVGVPRRPLKPKTEARIARGLDKFVLKHPRPYIVPIQHYGGTGAPVHDVAEPLRTITSHPKGGAFALATPYLSQFNHGGHDDRQRPIQSPMRTLTCSRDAHAIVAPLITRYNGQKSPGDSRCQCADEPIKTLDTSNRFGLVAPYLVSRYGERDGQDPRCRSIEQPAQTVTPTANGAQLVAAFINKHRGGVTGSAADEPLHTITAGSGSARPAGAAHAMGLSMVKLRGTCRDGQVVDRPAPTLTGGGNHAGLVAAFMASYYGEGSGLTGRDVRDPCPTIPTKERHQLVTTQIDGEEFVVVDVAMRMFYPHELLGCQFGDHARGYVLIGSKAEQVAMIGNSVPPDLAEAIVQANYKPLRVKTPEPELEEAAA